MKLLVGLGNPGERYERTRHNAGFMVLDRLARQAGAGKWSTQCQSLICTGKIGAEDVTLAKPLTYMNLSGRAVQLLLSEANLGPEDAILVFDDLNLAFGRIRIRERGSAGGHNGVESVVAVLGTEEIPRVRLGIGEDEMPEDKAVFVLSEFPPAREEELRDMLERAADAVGTIVTDGISRAMSVFNA